MPCYQVHKSQVLHMTATNNGSCIATDEHDRIERYRYAFRNENYLYRQEGLKGVLYYFAKYMYNILRIIIKSHDNKLRRIRMILSQMISGIRFNPEIEKIGDAKEYEK